MVLVPLTEAGLRSSMRDRRHWQPGHPEREDYANWVGRGWRALGGSPYKDPSGNSVVFVQACTRVRDGHTEEVSAHQRSTPARTTDNASAADTTPADMAAPRPSEVCGTVLPSSINGRRKPARVTGPTGQVATAA